MNRPINTYVVRNLSKTFAQVVYAHNADEAVSLAWTHEVHPRSKLYAEFVPPGQTINLGPVRAQGGLT